MPVNIAIIGAGPAGLTLARLLKVASVDVAISIFERDTSPTSRFFQGGTLDLHTDTGLAALKKAGLWEEALKHLRYDGEELFIADKNGTVIIHTNESPSFRKLEAKLDYERPEIDREVLRDMLLNSVEPEWVKWGKTLQSIESRTGVLTFQDGTTAGPFDLVVGADGAWSKVRPVVTDVQPHYSGVCGFESHIPHANDDYPNISKFVGRGSYFAYSDRKGVTIQRMGDESIKVGMWMTKEESYPADTLAAHGHDEDALKAKILEIYQDWLPKITQCIEVSTKFRPWPLYELPVGHTWEHKKGYTLIGDAASLMTPFAGEGVNKAMRDSLELAELLEEAIQGDNDVDEAVQKYEENMFPRAKKYQARTMQNKESMFSAGGSVAFMVTMVDVIAEELKVDIKHGWLSWVPFKTIMFCLGTTILAIGAWRRRISELRWFSGRKRD